MKKEKREQREREQREREQREREQRESRERAETSEQRQRQRQSSVCCVLLFASRDRGSCGVRCVLSGVV